MTLCLRTHTHRAELLSLRKNKNSKKFKKKIKNRRRHNACKNEKERKVEEGGEKGPDVAIVERGQRTKGVGQESE